MFYNVFWQVSVTRSVIKINISFWLLWDVALFFFKSLQRDSWNNINQKTIQRDKVGLQGHSVYLENFLA